MKNFEMLFLLECCCIYGTITGIIFTHRNKTYLTELTEPQLGMHTLNKSHLISVYIKFDKHYTINLLKQAYFITGGNTVISKSCFFS